MQIYDLAADDAALLEQTARLLLEGFRTMSPDTWPDMPRALAEVHESLAPERISRIMSSEAGEVLGWVGAIRAYNGHAYELHPLVVHAAYRRQGIGRALVADLERQVAARGACTLFLGTDDEQDMTTLAGRDLYPHVLEHLAHIANLRGHPYEFYQKVGFVLVGVLPDANGPGKPDIFMAKRVQPD
jgi:aminoglycoside 6'-N-acetyltransferase I